MPFNLDPEIAAGLAALSNGEAPPPPPAEGDVMSRRQSAEGVFSTLMPHLHPADKTVKRKDYFTKASDGASILLRWYYKEGSSPGSAVLYTHGGGMILGSVELYDPVVAHYVSISGVPILAIDYRLAPEFKHPIPIEDVYAGLTWLHEHATQLGVDARKIAVMGDSAGGLLAASVSLLARQRSGPGIAKQILIYPMLDDRHIAEDPQISPFLTWSATDNKTAWDALLGSARGTSSVSEVAAPGRMTDATGLPPAYIEVGELDYFRNEDIALAVKLGNAGISTELHVLPGCNHAFELFAPNSEVSKRSMVLRARAMTSIEAIELPASASASAKNLAKI